MSLTTKSKAIKHTFFPLKGDGQGHQIEDANGDSYLVLRGIGALHKFPRDVDGIMLKRQEFIVKALNDAALRDPAYVWKCPCGSTVVVSELVCPDCGLLKP